MSVKKYRSPSTGDPCTGAQFVAEIICQRMANKDKIGTLGYKFWNNPKWKKVYIRQVALANKFVKEFDEDIFVRFINSKQGKNIYSLGQRNLSTLIKNFEKTMVKNVSTEVSDEIIIPKEYKSRKSFGNKTLLEKLRKIDGR